MNKRIEKVKKLILGLGILYGFYGMKYKFYDTTSDYSRLKYGKEKFLRKKLKSIIKKYKSPEKFSNLRINSKEKTHFKKFPIWFCWFQGLENAPEIVKCCYNSICKNIDKEKSEIRIITFDNISDYIEVPSVIEKKYKSKTMPLALYSDFIRIALLSKYGGFWIDSTVLVTSNISNLCSNYDYYTKKSNMVELHFGNYLLQGRFAIHLLKADNNNLLVNFLYDALLLYHTKFNAIADYYLTNLLVDIAYNEIPEIKKIMDNLPFNDDGLESKLNLLLNDEFKEEKYKLFCDNMPFQKLSYKHDELQLNKNKKITYYGYIYNKYGDDGKHE